MLIKKYRKRHNKQTKYKVYDADNKKCTVDILKSYNGLGME